MRTTLFRPEAPDASRAPRVARVLAAHRLSFAAVSGFAAASALVIVAFGSTAPGVQVAAAQERLRHMEAERREQQSATATRALTAPDGADGPVALKEPAYASP